MKRIVRPWKPLTCCIATLCHLASPLLAGPQQASAVQTQETTPNTPPVIEDPIFTVDGTTKNIEPNIPIGKTLLIPVSATDADGDPLSYKVTSDDPKILVRVRTGRPHLKVNVEYAGYSGTTPTGEPITSDPFTGTLDFQLFRDWTPVTAEFIGGFAQSAFYSPRESGDSTKHTIFHRVIKDFMVQGGDPNAQSASATEHGPGFSFENEFDIPLIFSGRGQLAMANAGADYNTYAGSNGSQFFITTSSPRFLDVKHTIFGQLVHGWDVLEKIRNVPVGDQPIPAGASSDYKPEKDSRPKTDIKITGTSLQPNFTDALLVLSATGRSNSANITIQVSDGKGGTATKKLQVKAVKDEFNTPPFFTKLPENQVAPLNKITSIPVQAIDLEHDFFLYENALLPRYFPRGNSNRSGVPMLVLPSSASPGPMTLAFWPRQLEMSINGFGSDENQSPLSGSRDRRSIQLAVNDYGLKTEGVPVYGKPNETLNTVAVASYTDMDPRGQTGAANTISINWGDGTPKSSGLVARNTSAPAIGAYNIVGSHTYARPGVYPVVTTLENSNTGLKQLVYSTAVITDGALKVVGQKYDVKGKTFSGKPLATFKDLATNPSPGDYEATLDWGDGVVTAGEIKKTKAGDLYITGSHNYQDPETFSVAIRLHKKNTDPATDAYGWATLNLKGFQPAQQHLPPWSMGHMVGLINPVAKDQQNYKPIRTTSGGGADAQTTFTLSLSILNTGDKKVNPSKIRFYLSADDRLNLQPEKYMDGPPENQVERTNPADIPLTIGKKQKDLSIIALKPGQGGSISFDLTKSGDNRLYAPKGEDGTGYYLLAAFDYDDPLAKDLPIDKEVALDVAPAFTVSPTTLEVTEFAGAKHTQEFKVRFYRRPKQDVAIKMSIVGSDGEPNKTTAFFNAAPPPPPEGQPNLPPEKNLEETPDYTLVYTRAMWDANQKEIAVKVTAKEDNDNPVADSTVYVQMDAAVSDDPIYHGRSLSPVRIVNRELTSFIKVDPLTLTTTEAAGTDHAKTFTVTLQQKPTTNLVVPIVVSDPAEGAVTGQDVNGQNTLTVIDGKPSLTFTPSETYPVTRTLTLTSIDDNEADGDATYHITIGPSVSADPTKDPAFHGLTPPEISVTNTDNQPTTPTDNSPTTDTP